MTKKLNIQSDRPLYTYEDVEQGIWDIVETHIVNGAFVKHLHQGAYSLNQIREFAVQYSFYSRNFPRVLGTAIGVMEPSDSWWVPIVDNLWDEAGRGKPAGYHSRLYRTFLKSAAPEVETKDNYVVGEPISPGVEEAIHSFISFLHHATPLEAMAAVGLGSELFAGKVMGLIGEGLRHPHYNKNSKLNVTFWMIHSDQHEPRHYQLCKDILVQSPDPQDLTAMYRAGAYIALSEARMYQTLHERMMAIE
jgi:pyrroloquinoline-quinone synthase